MAENIANMSVRVSTVFSTEIPDDTLEIADGAGMPL
jgi:hypothetical protein